MEPKRALRSAQSSAEGLQSASHRLDLLITEQRTLVRTTQEALQEALTKYQTSSSKEEQESARMQVQSLLTRAQELVLTVQVILHIRAEIGHTQQEIQIAKASHEPMSKLYSRLQWLEQHLEKMLMARRRGRPGGRRVQPAGLSRGVRGRTETQYRGTVLSVGTVSRGDNISDFDGVSIQDSHWKSTESNETSSNVRNTSSKQSASHDSDVWCSESEANWTMVETTYSGQPKDITQSQVLSDEEQKPSRLTYTPSWSKSALMEHSVSPTQLRVGAAGEKRYALVMSGRRASEGGGSVDKSQEGGYHFEPKRSTKVFGDYSWNSLRLAANTNLVQSTSSMTKDILGLSMEMLIAGVSDITKDIESLKKLIVNAGQAATNPGPLVTANKMAVHFILSSRQKSAARRSLKMIDQSSANGSNSLPSLEDITSECSKLSPSKKAYGRQVVRNRSSTYPRSTSVWYKSSDKNSFHQPSSESQPAISRLSTASKSPTWLRQTSRGVSKASNHSYQDDIFEKEKHQDKCIDHLLEQTWSPVSDVRKNSVQALGLLPCSRGDVERRLQDLMMADKSCLVQYEAFKSLVSLGMINAEIISFAGCCLKGSPELSFNLLLFLSQEHIVQYTSMKTNDINLSMVEAIQQDLFERLKCDDHKMAFAAAILLSRAGLEKEGCVPLLNQILGWSSPEDQKQALSCLVKCWQCFDSSVICSALEQMKKLHNWKLRQHAVECLQLIDKETLLLLVDETGKKVYNVLLQRLPNEPILAVRLTIGKLLAHMELDTKAENALIGRLERKSEVVRAEALIALSAFENPNTRNIHILVDCLNLDPSIYVRIQVVRLFSKLRYSSPLIMNQLIDKSKGRGPVAKECVNVLQGMSKF